MINMKQVALKSLTEKDFKQLGVLLANWLQPGQTICLTGDLGAGKTTIAKALIAALGVNEPVTSPTYTLMNFYETAKGKLCHMDAYRLGDADALFELGFDDLVHDGVIFIIEWADVIRSAMPQDALWLELHYADSARDLLATGPEAAIAQMMEEFDHARTMF